MPNEGTFIMVDPFRRQGESLEAYRRRASEVGACPEAALMASHSMQCSLTETGMATSLCPCLQSQKSPVLRDQSSLLLIMTTNAVCASHMLQPCVKWCTLASWRFPRSTAIVVLHQKRPIFQCGYYYQVGETWVSMGPEAQAKFIKHMQACHVMGTAATVVWMKCTVE